MSDLMIRRRHPRFAVWQGWALEYALPVMGFAAALLNAVTRAWDAVPPWLLVGSIALIHQYRLQYVWKWGWREGHEETLRRTMPHVQVDASNIEELREALNVDGPSWRQRQDELSQIDFPATAKANMEQLERMWADWEKRGPK